MGCAATYAYHLTQAHAFIDGNKRIAAAITETFLETNGVQLIMTNDEIVQIFSADRVRHRKPQSDRNHPQRKGKHRNISSLTQSCRPQTIHYQRNRP
ncbi:MAG: type II toxin-antitoxin system death-on-curing family toxin [Pyrinomonadaceae bacterium]